MIVTDHMKLANNKLYKGQHEKVLMPNIYETENSKK